MATMDDKMPQGL